VAVVMSLLIFSGVLAVLPARAAAVPLDDLDAGDLIRGESFSAVYYYGADGFRYVFPNDKAYFTWYNDFDDVEWISDADLGKLQIGGNVTYKPGVKMIKINTDPKTYAVDEGGMLRHVSSEEIAIALYGNEWNKMIDDVADGFFSNYTIGEAIADADDFDPADVEVSVEDVNDDKNLIAPMEVRIIDNDFTLSDVTIEAGQTVRFTNEGDNKHTVTANDLSFGSGTMNGGDVWVRRFDEQGIYDYECSYHSSMTGSVRVE
jgi:plastocyanin